MTTLADILTTDEARPTTALTRDITYVEFPPSFITPPTVEYWPIGNTWVWRVLINGRRADYGHGTSQDHACSQGSLRAQDICRSRLADYNRNLRLRAQRATHRAALLNLLSHGLGRFTLALSYDNEPDRQSFPYQPSDAPLHWSTNQCLCSNDLNTLLVTFPTREDAEAALLRESAFRPDSTAGHTITIIDASTWAPLQT